MTKAWFSTRDGGMVRYDQIAAFRCVQSEDESWSVESLMITNGQWIPLLANYSNRDEASEDIIRVVKMVTENNI